MFLTYHWVMLLLLFTLRCSSARLMHHRHHRHHSNDSYHDHHTRRNSSQHNAQRTVQMQSTAEPLKLTLVNAYPNGFFNSQVNRRWNANNNEQRDVEINWNREPTALTTSATASSTTTLRSLRDRSYTKQNVGRNVCGDQRTITTSVNTNHMREPCQNSALCSNGFGFPSAAGGFKHRVTKQYIHNCCPGWAQLSKSSHGCTKPICNYPCKNGGKCVKPDTCSCSSGFTGRFCELDVNECQEEKPCDQACYNTLGSYYCKCRDGFQLMGDKQSCKKLSTGLDDTAFEAKDLENDVDYDQLSSKISKIEKLIGTEQEMNNELQKKIHSSAATMNQLRQRIDHMERRQHEINFIKDKVNSLNYLVDLLYKCRTKPSIFCPLQS